MLLLQLGNFAQASKTRTRLAATLLGYKTTSKRNNKFQLHSTSLGGARTDADAELRQGI